MSIGEFVSLPEVEIKSGMECLRKKSFSQVLRTAVYVYIPDELLKLLLTFKHFISFITIQNIAYHFLSVDIAIVQQF